MYWALRKIFTRQQTFSAPKFVRIADDKGNVFVMKKSRKTWSSNFDQGKKRAKIRANFQSDERFKEAFVCLNHSSDEFVCYYIIEVSSQKNA